MLDMLRFSRKPYKLGLVLSGAGRAVLLMPER